MASVCQKITEVSGSVTLVPVAECSLCYVASDMTGNLTIVSPITGAALNQKRLIQCTPAFNAGAFTFKIQDGIGGDLVSTTGTISKNKIYELKYNGTKWVLVVAS